MDREHVKGIAEKAKGAIKDTAGKVTDDKKLAHRLERNFGSASGSAAPQKAMLSELAASG